jgi:hypothetical protein
MYFILWVEWRSFEEKESTKSFSKLLWRTRRVINIVCRLKSGPASIATVKDNYKHNI